MAQSIKLEEVMLEEMDDGNKKEISEISEIIENSDIKEDDKERIIGIIRQEVFRGPIPHPQILQQYEEVHKGFAEEIVNMAIREQNHRHELEKKVVESEILLDKSQVDIVHASIKLKTRLQIFGFASTGILLIVGSACIFLNKDMGGIGSFILAIGSFCWTMFYGKKNDKDNVDSDDGKIERDNTE